jgi:hypothetical protein
MTGATMTAAGKAPGSDVDAARTTAGSDMGCTTS